MKGYVTWNGLVSSILINFDKNGIMLRGKYGNVLGDIFVCLASIDYFFYVSLKSFMTYKRSVKEKLLSFISYSVLFISIAPQSHAPKFSRSSITRSPIPCSLIARSATFTSRLIFPPDHSLPYCLVAPTHPVHSLLMSNLLSDLLISLPLIFETFPWTPHLIYIEERQRRFRLGG